MAFIACFVHVLFVRYVHTTYWNLIGIGRIIFQYYVKSVHTVKTMSKSRKWEIYSTNWGNLGKSVEYIPQHTLYRFVIMNLELF